MKRALIFGGGVYEDVFPEISDTDIVIAADKGNEILRSRGIIPLVTVGDFDSSSEIPEENAVVLPVEKDITDSHAAVNIALEMGAEEIVIYGGMGGRPDHTYANYCLAVSLAQKGVRVFLEGEGYIITAVKNGSLALKGGIGKTVSVFSFSEVSEGVSFKGLHYPLNNAVLKNDFALGVSNSLDAEQAEISVKNGTLLVMIEK